MAEPTYLHQIGVREPPKSASYSSVTLHRKCPNAWQYRHLRGLAKIEDDRSLMARDFGTWWHGIRAADAIERGRRLGSLITEPKKIKLPTGDLRVSEDGEIPGKVVNLVTAVFALAESAWARMPLDAQDAFVDRMGESLPDRLSNLDRAYRLEHFEATKTERPLAVELKWVRESNGKTFTGYIDEVYQDTARGIVVARDHKTAGSLGTQSTADDMMDSQLDFYAWGSGPQLKEHGYSVQAVAYDRVRSIKAKTPQLTLSGTLSKSVTDYDLHTYVEWVGEGIEYPGRKKDGSGAGVYQPERSVMEKLASPAARSAWMQRTLRPLNRNVIVAHLRAGLATADDMERTVAMVESTGQAGRNLSKDNCRFCDFSKLCRAQMVGGADGDYMLSDYDLTTDGRP